MIEKLLAYAPTAVNALNGVFCVYKPLGMTRQVLVDTLRTRLANSLNQLPCRPPRQIVSIKEDGLKVPVVTSVPDIADSTLVVGPRYLPEDFYIHVPDPLKKETSGVQVIGIGTGTNKTKKMELAKYMRVYHAHGELGTATDNYTPSGRIIERSTYRHVTLAKIERVLSAIQASHQRQMFQYSGVDIQSQDAYELAAQGLIRPKGYTVPLIYGIRCIEFEPPVVNLEIHVIGEKESYLQQVINDLGLELKTTAMCTQLRRIRYGNFVLDHALLRKHWDIENILENIKFCANFGNKKLLSHKSEMRLLEKDDRPLLDDGNNRYLDSESR